MNSHESGKRPKKIPSNDYLRVLNEWRDKNANEPTCKKARKRWEDVPFKVSRIDSRDSFFRSKEIFTRQTRQKANCKTIFSSSDWCDDLTELKKCWWDVQNRSMELSKVSFQLHSFPENANAQSSPLSYSADFPGFAPALQKRRKKKRENQREESD